MSPAEVPPGWWFHLTSVLKACALLTLGLSHTWHNWRVNPRVVWAHMLMHVHTERHTHTLSLSLLQANALSTSPFWSFLLALLAHLPSPSEQRQEREKRGKQWSLLFPQFIWLEDEEDGFVGMLATGASIAQLQDWGRFKVVLQDNIGENAGTQSRAGCFSKCLAPPQSCFYALFRVCR